MKIAIFEKQLNKILGDPDVINEQNEVVDDKRTLIVLQNRVNQLIDKKEKEILDKTSIKVVLNKGIVSLQIGEKAYPMRPMVKGVYATVIPPNSTLSFDGTQMSTLLPEIEKIAEYKSLAEKHPELKEQIAQGRIKGTIFTDEQNQGTFKLTVTKKPMDPKDMKFAVEFGTEYPLGEFLENNKLVYKFKAGSYGTLESGQISMNLSSAPINFTQQSPETAIVNVANATIKTLDLQDLFNYNDAEFKNPDGATQQLGSYIQEMKGYIEKYGQPFIDGYKAKNPTVYGYASIDGDPNQKIIGEYRPCAGNGTRKEYDLCLSQERARKIAETLNQSLPELGGAIKFKGMGETNKWGPSWTPQKPTIPEQTAPNRRFILPSIMINN
jgi:outer membrane protein OmpA-like peptidoglycan-associated protein